MCIFCVVQHSHVHEWAQKKRKWVVWITNCLHSFHPGTPRMKCNREENAADCWRIKKKKIPFSYELSHLFLHLFSLQLFVQQNLKSCEAAIALGVLLISLRDKHREHMRNTIDNKHGNITPRPSSLVKYTTVYEYICTLINRGRECWWKCWHCSHFLKLNLQ